MRGWVVLLLALGCGGGREEAGPGADAGTGGVDARPAEDAGAVDPGPEPCSEHDPRLPGPEVFVGPEGLRERLVGLFASAERSLLVSTYILDDAAIMSALEDAAARGVAVRVLLDPDRSETAAALARLEAAGVRVRRAPGMYEHFHPKTIVVDETLAVVMSANLNGYSMSSERNHGVVLRDAWDVADLRLVFDYDWNQAIAPVDLGCTRLVLVPENGRARLEALLASATTELRVQHLSLSDRDVRAALAAQASAGVRVRVILADPEWIEGNAEAASVLGASGVEVRFFTALENHAKLVVADTTAAFVGSENFSWTSLTQNREIGVVLSDGPSATTLASAFDADWERSATP